MQIHVANENQRDTEEDGHEHRARCGERTRLDPLLRGGSKADENHEGRESGKMVELQLGGQSMETQSSRAQHGADDFARLREAFGAEEGPAEEHRKKSKSP